MSDWLHLTRRFCGSLWPGGPSAEQTRWAESQLLDAEVGLWRRMSGQDRRHAVGVARDVERRLGADADRAVLAAALLHDVGKIDAGLGTFGRVIATLSGKVAGREMAREWQRRRGLTRRVGLYLRHDEVGADLLAMAGSDSLTVAWAREHHGRPADWTVEAHIAAALDAADND